MNEGQTVATIVWILNVGAFGVLGWVVRHTFTRTIPGIVAEFRAALTELRKSYETQGAADRKLHEGIITKLLDKVDGAERPST